MDRSWEIDIATTPTASKRQHFDGNTGDISSSSNNINNNSNSRVGIRDAIAFTGSETTHVIVICYLDLVALPSLALVCRGWYRLISRNRLIWFNMWKQ
jgi:hypothetical protein